MNTGGPSGSQFVFVGDESLLLQCVVIAREAGHHVAAISTRSDGVRRAALEQGIDVLQPSELAEFVSDHQVDVLFSIANERVLGREVIEGVGLAINFHDGPLPAYKGLAVTTWAIHNGETSHAVTWHTMTAEVDAGEIVAVESFAIDPAETAFSLNARCYEAALKSFPAVLEALHDRSAFAPQDDAKGGWYGRYDRPVVLLEAQTSAAELERGVRALALGPRIRNRLGAVRWVVDDRAVVIGACRVEVSSGAPVGSIDASIAPEVRVSLRDADVVLSALTDPDGNDLAELRLSVTATVGSPAGLGAALAAADQHLARHESFWTDRLARVDVAVPAHVVFDDTAPFVAASVAVPDGCSTAELAAACLVWWARASAQPVVWFDHIDAAAVTSISQLAPLLRPALGRFSISEFDSFEVAFAGVDTELADISRRGPFLTDLVGRDPATRHHTTRPALALCFGADADASMSDASFVVMIDAVASTFEVRARLAPGSTSIDMCAEQIATVLAAARQRPSTSLSRVPIVSATEQARLDTWNATDLDSDRGATVDAQFRAQVARTPHAAAVSSGARTLSYAELSGHVDAFASTLRAVGAGEDSLIGLALDRDVELLVAVLAVLSIGAAYVPLDPEYPEDRLAYMVDDSGLVVLVGTADIAQRIGAAALPVVSPGDADTSAAAGDPGGHGPDDLAYVIYTSGSTGRPKGVMLQHGNVVNFFAAMDAVIDHDPPGTWLAVTSLSFDISVLELLWTVTRGFHVVVQRHGIASAANAGRAPVRAATATRPASISLFFFAAGDAQAGDGYRLLRESARVADEHGFEAIWLPERHFHEFGGAYPNPSVLAAAVAALTTSVAIRAGSVVLPLHASARVAEEWSVVDNLSHGRVGISFAPGWQPNDFVLNPDGYRTAKESLQTRIDEVRALWRGDSLDMTGPDGNTVAVRTLPRPVQAELPVWLTSAGTTATFERAGTMGVNLLTHLLGQSVDQLAANIEVYRRAWRDAGHDGDGHITVMLHTFLCADSEQARATAEQPMKRYLTSATGLLKDLASAFPTFANAGASADEAFRSLSESELDELLTIAARRYLDTSGLFGNVDDAGVMADEMSRIGVDEIACLIDFGIDTEPALESLQLLAELNDRLRAQSATAVDVAPAGHEHDGVGQIAARHRITHMQCTPSLAAMLLAEPGDREVLSRIDHLMVGGEALPDKLARELRSVLTGRLTNMYGPTETTIWSLVHEIAATHAGPVPIGKPIANTVIHVLDTEGEGVPIGALGELHIGGDGVARGYLNRDELTAQRFVDRPGLGRLYATGDLARIGDDGVVEFAGRVDFQVKIRGHRIELGEIETHLDEHPSVERSVVVARGDAGDARLVGFVVPAGGGDIDSGILRKHLMASLPDIMVPDVIVAIAELPLTPNGKVDRAALPADVGPAIAEIVVSEAAAPQDDLEQLVADVWVEQLRRGVGRTDNFFDLGGHSLLAVAVFRRLQQATGLPIALTDVFRYPTIAAFAAFLGQLGAKGGPEASATGPAAPTGADRGAMRRRMLDRRRGEAAGTSEGGAGQ